jgi:hypothetical protein
MEKVETVTFGIRPAEVRRMDERILSACCVDETRLYRLHRHRKFRSIGMQSKVVQSVDIGVFEGSLCLHFEKNRLCGK